MKRPLLLLITFMFSLAAMAQDFPYGQIDNAALDMKKYDKDTSAHAVVLNEHGISRINFNTDYRVMITYEYHTKIKFFDSKEFDREGTIAIHLYGSGDNVHYESVDDLKATTYYKDDNGSVQQEKLDSKKIFSVKNSSHWQTMKFAMPALRNGCIIEISYKIISPYLGDFHSWNFQGHIPRVNSEYEVHIPGFWNYNASLRGFLKLTKNKSEIEKECFRYGQAVADCSHITYGISDVPAFIEEDYMTSDNNYISSVNFELTESTDFNNGAKTKYSKDWKDIDYNLKSEPWFGRQLKRTELMKDRIAPLIANKTDQLEKAQIIYNYVKNTIKWDDNESFGSTDGIRQALLNHKGNAGDVNLALVAALNAGGIPTEAVMLSTRGNGNLNKLYPNIGNFNYVIAKANIGDKSYLLDATEPLLPFGMLPMRCLNDQGRVFSLDKPSYWIDLSTGQRENETNTLDLTLQDNGKLKGTYTRYSSGYSGYLRRKEIKKYNSIDEYVESLGGAFGNTKILKSDITNLDSLDKPLSETFEVEINLFDDTKHERLSLNPYIFGKVTTNPFKLTERDFPVDWGMPSDDRYVLNMHLPQQYSIESPIQPIAVTMPNQSGKFFTAYEGDKQNFTLSYDTQFNKSVYGPDEYGYLKELYNRIILAEKTEITFKKKL
jgi:hypothetical protein